MNSLQLPFIRAKWALGILLLSGIVLFILIKPVTLLATTTLETAPVTTVEEKTTEEEGWEAYQESVGLPDVTVERASGFVQSKLYDIVEMLQIIVRPLAMIAVVVSLLTALFGAFGDSGLVYKGLIGVVIAGLCYFGVMFAPEILDFIFSWMSEGSDTLFPPQV